MFISFCFCFFFLFVCLVIFLFLFVIVVVVPWSLTMVPFEKTNLGSYEFFFLKQDLHIQTHFFLKVGGF